MLFLFVLGCTLGVSSEPAKTTFKSPNGFSVQYGAKLQRLKQKAELSLLHTGAGSEDSSPAMVITSRKTVTGKSPKRIFDSAVNRLKTKHRANNLVVGSQLKAGGANFYTCTYDRVTPKGSKTSCHAYNHYNPKTGLNVFILTVEPRQSKGKYHPDFEDVVKTFRVNTP